MGTTNDKQITLKFLGQRDLVEAGLLNIGEMMEIVQRGLLSYYERRIIYPGFHYVWVDRESVNRIKSMPLASKEESVAHMLWETIFPVNPSKYGIQNVTALEILNDGETGLPIAVMDGTVITNLRVGLMAGLGAKYLALPQARVLGFIGAGEQAKNVLLGMIHARPGLREVRVFAKTLAEQEAFIACIKPLFPKLDFVSAKDGRDAVADADIIVTATSAQAPLLKNTWVKAGSFYAHVAGWEDEYEVARHSDKIVVDDWAKVKECHTQTITRMYDEGVLTEKDIYAEFPEIILGKKKGRESDRERIYFDFVNQVPEMFIAHALYRNATAKGLGREFVLQDQPLFERSDLSQKLHL